MEAELFKKYYRMFLLETIILFPISIAFLVIGIVFWRQYIHDGTELWIAIFFTCLTLIAIPLTIKVLLPFFKDLPYFKRKEVIIIEGVVEGYKKVAANGEPPTVDYYPIVKVEGQEEKLVLSVDAQLGVKYKFAYLPHTKLAIIIEKCCN